MNKHISARITSFLKVVTVQSMFFIQITSCQGYHHEKYDWVAAIGAPEEYPITIINGQFVSNDGYSPYLPTSDFSNNGWGNSGGVMVVGPDKKPVPDSLNVKWFSFAENKLYIGNFPLSKDRLNELLKEGYWDKDINSRQDYDFFTLGFSPGGYIVLWLSGGVRQVEVCNFKGREIDLNKHNLGRDRAYLLDSQFVKESYERHVAKALSDSVAKRGIQYRRFKEWQTRYNWHYKVNSEDVNYHYLLPLYFNSESEEIFNEILTNNPFEQRAVPKEIFVVWFDKKKQKMSTNIVFDEDEIRSAFAAILKNDRGELYFKVDPNEYTVQVSLKSGDKVTNLVKQKSETSLMPQ